MKKIVLLSVIASAMLMAGGDIQEPEVIEEVMEEVAEVEVEEEMVEDVDEGSMFEGVYFGGAVSGVMEKGTNVTGLKDFDELPITVMGQAGYKINDYVALEGRYWTNLITKLSLEKTSGQELELVHAQIGGVYLKPMYPVLDSLDVYGLLGYAFGEHKSIKLKDDNGFSNGLSFGGGASFDVYSGIAMFADYVMFDSSDNLDTSAINVGMNYKF